MTRSQLKTVVGVPFLVRAALGALAIAALPAAIFITEHGAPATQAGPFDQGAGVGQAVLDALQDGAYVEVDVAFRAPDAMAGSGAADVETLKAQIAELRAGVLQGLHPSDFQLDRQFQTLPGFSGTVTQAGLYKLAAHPDVLRIDLPAAVSTQVDQMVPLIGADTMHAVGYTGEGVTIAVLDTGIDTDHTDLGNDLVGEECFIECANQTDRQSGSGAAEDDHGHGTNVIGIITSTGTVSNLGIAPDADIFAYKVLNADGMGNLASNLIPALDDIIANHPEVDIVNMSLSSNALFIDNCDETTATNIIMATAIDTLRTNGAITFASAGNSGSGSSMGSPACIANAISVGATYDADIGTYSSSSCTDLTTAADMVTCFSNSNSTTDIFAPGCRATSTGLDNGTSTLCGTSMASPASAACAALLLEEDPSLTPAQIEFRLEAGPVSVTDPTNGLSFPRIGCSFPFITPTPCPPEGCPTAPPTHTPTPTLTWTPVPEAGLLGPITKLNPVDSSGCHCSNAVSGDTAILGSAFDSGVGAASIFQRNYGGADNWGEVKKLTGSDSEAGDFFGNDVAISGDTAVVDMWDTRGPNPGGAYVFQRDNGGVDNWGQVKKLTAPGGQSGDNFGWSVAISGNTIVVGARAENSGGDNGGAAYVFQRDQGGADNWGQVKRLAASDADASDKFGQSVTVSGDTAVVGASLEHNGVDFFTGAAYIFQQNEGGPDNWGEVKKLKASDAEAFDSFGWDVAISGDTAVIGSYDSQPPYSGQAYILHRNQGGADNWGEVKILTGAGSEASEFGQAVAVSGSTAVIGSGTNSAAFVHRTHEGGTNNWGEVVELTIAYDVAVSGNTAITSWDNLGYVFYLPQEKGTPTPCPTEGCPPTVTPSPTPTPTMYDPTNTDGDGCTDQQENGPNEFLGGRRDFLNPWDYYDPTGDGFIRMDDIMGVMEHYSTTGAPPYDVTYDRDIGGPDRWDMTAPDGRIDLAPDIVGVLDSYHHDCATAPPPGPTPAASAGLAFSIGVDADGDTTDDCDTRGGGATCTLTPNTASDNITFALNFYLDSLPNGVSAYKGLHVELTYTGVSIPFRSAILGTSLEEWDDCDAATNRFYLAAGEFATICITNLLPLPTFLESSYTGLIGSVEIDCTGHGQISMVHGKLDTALFVDASTVHIEENASTDTLTINCGLPPTVTPTPTPTYDPTDTDGDGCTDQQENGPDETLGGLRDPNNPWDFYDVLGAGGGPPDGLIDLPNDILGVILRFSPQGLPPYDAAFDRGPSSGPNVWNMTAPDGVIDLPNDILGVILQFDHSCQ